MDILSMDTVLDDIPDIPEYVTPPAGEYLIQVQYAELDFYVSRKSPGEEKQRIKVTYEVLETTALASDKDLPVPDGSLFTETFTANPVGLSFFKKRVKSILPDYSLQGVPLVTVLDAIRGVPLKARLSHQKSVSDGVEYNNVRITVRPA